MKRSNITTKLLLLAMTLLSSNLWAQVTAEFTSNVTTGCSLPFVVQFTDQSTTVSGTINLRNWDFGNGTTSSATNPTATYSQPGVYNVRLIVRNSLNQRDTVVKTAYIDLSGAFTVTSSVSNATCYNCPDGSISLNMTGGTGPYTYLWSNGSTAHPATGLQPGSYTTTVTDVNGCSAVTNSQVKVVCQPIDVDLVQDPSPSCYGYFDGILRGSATGGRSPYSYVWFDPYYVNPCPPPGPPCPPGPPAPDTLAGVGAGTYILTIYDQDGCTGADTITVTTPAEITVVEAITHATCPTCPNGAIDITVTGGTAPYTYVWSQASTTEDIAGLLSDNYSVTVTDAAGCNVTQSFNVTYCTLTVSINTTDATCVGSNDGSATATPAGGTAPYTYAWSHGSTVNPVTAILPGNYSMTVTDAVGCSITDTFSISDPNPIYITEAITDATCSSCADGIIDINPSGGVGGYTYTWSIGATTTAIQNLLPGSYSVIVTDANGCSATETYTIGIACPGFSIQMTSTVDVLCFGDNIGSATVGITGGQAPYSYLWSNNTTASTATNLAAGNYTVTVADNNGCSATEAFTINSPNAIQIVEAITDATCPTCPDGIIDVSPNGGVGSYLYEWSNGVVGPTSITNLLPGTYNLTVTDDNGCIASESYTVGPPLCNNFNVSLGNDTAICFGSYTITATVLGAAVPYTYHWFDGSTTPSIMVTSPGTYSITVTDPSLCTVASSISIADVATLAMISGDTTICTGGSASLWASGGNSYSWTPATGLSNPNDASTWANPTVTTNYTVEVDNGGCITSVPLLVTVDNTCTWPGDADNNGIADNDDVLAIGIGYGDTGPLRNLPSLVWEGQNGPLWTNSLISGSNYKYIDTDGNGTIDNDDTLAISLNYGLTHVKTEEERESSVPSIFIVLPDSVEAGQTVQGQIYFGTDSFPLTNVYGVKFSMNYNPDFVAENTVSFNFGPSWMGTPGTDLLTFQKDLHSSGRIDGAITGINHVNRSGFGLLGTANFTMKDDISGKDLITESLVFSFTDVRAIDINEVELTVTGGETTIIATQLVGIRQVNNTLPAAVYPNPALDVLYINTYNQPIQSITMHNVLGMVFELPTTIQNGIYKLDTGHLPAGVYMVTIQSGESVATKRVVLNR